MKLKEIYQNYKKAQEAGAVLPCPRCGKTNMEGVKLTLSKTEDVFVCDDCKRMEEYQKTPSGEWFLATAFGLEDYHNLPQEHYVINANLRVRMTAEDIDNIMCSVLEGGITYWCKKCEVVGDYLGEYASDQISRDGVLKLYDREDNKCYELTLEKFLRGFSMACAHGYANTWVDDDMRIDTCQIDSVAADIIVQYAIFGEVIYG